MTNAIELDDDSIHIVDGFAPLDPVLRPTSISPDLFGVVFANIGLHFILLSIFSGVLVITVPGEILLISRENVKNQRNSTESPFPP